MAIDHFIKHKRQINRIDWNFNFLFNDQPQVAALAAQYAPLLDHPGLHKPIPGPWLHGTLLRVGFYEDFTEQEMLKVAALIEPKLAEMQMPKLMLGPWWIWNGNPCLHMVPEEPMRNIFDWVVQALTEVVGPDRLPDKLRYTPHITLAYSKTYDDEVGLYKQLDSKHIKGVGFQANSLSLIKQHIEDDYYAWDIVKDLPIGQTQIQ